MSSTNQAPHRADPIARHVRPLPSAPSLEYERKEAKTLLKRIRAGKADALRRVETSHPISLRDRQHDALQLADAQHVIAREYGFASWPRLVEYFDEMERHRHAPRYNSSDDGLALFEQHAQSVVQRHQRGDEIIARELAHFVPRFYARPVAEILATPITDDEARLVVARQRRRVSWTELIERSDLSSFMKTRNTWERDSAPLHHARLAIRDHDTDALAAMLDENPELLTPSVIDREQRSTLASIALSVEYKYQNADARRMTDFLASRGVDIQRELNERLLGWPHDTARPESVRWYLERGANPNWMPPNGITVLEHAIVRYRNGEYVDVIAERVAPRRALWIAAGLGDVAGVRSFIARKGLLTSEARMNRPDLIAMGSVAGRGLPPNRDADDLEIMWEAFQIAGWNQRWAAMDALLDAGLPVDHAPMVWPMVIEAIGDMLVPLAEFLISRGADLDREWPSPANGSAREFARAHVKHFGQSEDARRMLAICDAGALEEILVELEAERSSPPPLWERTMRVMQLAADDAARQGQSTVTTENMLIGFLRVIDGGLA
ncbi:MAG: hypothetical protein ABJE10_16550, partial [bacterium]